MASAQREKGKGLLGRALKLIGTLTDPKATTTGKLFNYWERGMTSALEQLAQNNTYLNFAGKMMTQGFRVQAESIRSTEAILRAMRLPTTSEMDALRDELRKVTEQNEALSLQLEVVLEKLEQQSSGQHKG